MSILPPFWKAPANDIGNIKAQNANNNINLPKTICSDSYSNKEQHESRDRSSPKGEGDLAVLILLDGDQRLNLPRKLLPPKAKEGSWLTLDIVGGQPQNIKLDDKATSAARQRIAAKKPASSNGIMNEFPPHPS